MATWKVGNNGTVIGEGGGISDRFLDNRVKRERGYRRGGNQLRIT